MKSLQIKVEDNLILSREKFLLKLVMGGVSSAEAIDQSQQFGLDILARYYLVALIRVELCEDAQPFDYHEYQKVERIVSQFAGNNPDVFLTKKDPEELVLLIKGDALKQLVQEGEFLAGLIKDEVENQTTCNAVIEMGTPQNRLGDIHHSFAEALVKTRSNQTIKLNSRSNPERVDLIKIDHAAIENYLKFGTIQDFDTFFSNTILPICEITLQFHLVKQYLFVDIILTTSQFVSDLGGTGEEMESDIYEIDHLLKELTNLEKIKDEVRKLFISALNFRDSQMNHERGLILHQARAYIDDSFADPELQMRAVARKFNISSSHFSTLFHQEFGETFRDYLGELRLNLARELLRTTNLKIAEVAYRSGFSDPHYFSTVFKKKTGFTPLQFRANQKNIS